MKKRLWSYGTMSKSKPIKPTRYQLLEAYGVLQQIHADPDTSKYIIATLKDCMDILNSYQRACLYDND